MILPTTSSPLEPGRFGTYNRATRTFDIDEQKSREVPLVPTLYLSDIIKYIHSQYRQMGLDLILYDTTCKVLCNGSPPPLPGTLTLGISPSYHYNTQLGKQKKSRRSKHSIHSRRSKHSVRKQKKSRHSKRVSSKKNENNVVDFTI